MPFMFFCKVSMVLCPDAVLTKIIVYRSCCELSLFCNAKHPNAHWQILCWNVSKSWLQKVNFFKNYAIVAMQSDNVNLYAYKMIKVTSGFDFKKTFFSARRRHHPKNSWNIFQIQIIPLFWRPQGPQGCLVHWVRIWQFGALKLDPKLRN